MSKKSKQRIATIQTKDGIADMNQEELNYFLRSMCEEAYVALGETEFLKYIHFETEENEHRAAMAQSFMAILAHTREFKKYY